MGELRDKVEGEVKDTGGKVSGDKKMEWEGKGQKPSGVITGDAFGRGGRSPIAHPDVAQGRFAQDKEEQQRDRAEEEIRSKPAVVDEEANHEPDQRHQEGRDRAHVGEFVLEVMPREDLAKPVLETGAAGLARRGGRRSGRSRAGDRV